LPSGLLLQRLLPVLDVIRHDLRRLVSSEVAANGLDEVAFRIYAGQHSQKYRTKSNIPIR
jgi:hypothetical protein